MAQTLPLHDLRVADLSAVTAGAGSTSVLGDFGADVIKIEAPDRPDLFRGGLGGRAERAPGDGVPETPPLVGAFTTVNRNKRALAVDLKKPEGLEIVRRLIAVSDVVVENFHRGVLERLGLGFDELVKVQDKIVLVTIASQGATGPNVGYGSYGCVIDALSGLASLTGYDASTPRWSTGKVNFPDQLVSMYAPGVIIAGILAARASGSAKWIDFSQREATTSIIGEWVLQCSITGVDPVPTANQGAIGLEWTSPCQGEDEWVAISIPDDDAFGALAKALGQSELASDTDFRTEDARAKNATKIKSLVGAWTSTRHKVEAMELLQGAGVPAAAVMKSYEAHADPYLKSIDFFREVAIPPERTELERGFIGRFDAPNEGQLNRRAPFVGEHTTEVLTDVLGYSPDDVERFMSDRVVAGT